MDKRNYDLVKDWYEKAEKQYQKTGKLPGDHGLMDTLEDVMRQLYEGGWLKKEG